MAPFYAGTSGRVNDTAPHSADPALPVKHVQPQSSGSPNKQSLSAPGLRQTEADPETSDPGGSSAAITMPCHPSSVEEGFMEHCSSKGGGVAEAAGDGTRDHRGSHCTVDSTSGQDEPDKPADAESLSADQPGHKVSSGSPRAECAPQFPPLLSAHASAGAPESPPPTAAQPEPDVLLPASIQAARAAAQGVSPDPLAPLHCVDDSQAVQQTVSGVGLPSSSIPNNTQRYGPRGAPASNSRLSIGDVGLSLSGLSLDDSSTMLPCLTLPSLLRASPVSQRPSGSADVQLQHTIELPQKQNSAQQDASRDVAQMSDLAEHANLGYELDPLLPVETQASPLPATAADAVAPASKHKVDEPICGDPTERDTFCLPQLPSSRQSIEYEAVETEQQEPVLLGAEGEPAAIAGGEESSADESSDEESYLPQRRAPAVPVWCADALLKDYAATITPVAALKHRSTSRTTDGEQEAMSSPSNGASLTFTFDAEASEPQSSTGSDR